jgi:hypothetical protein
MLAMSKGTGKSSGKLLEKLMRVTLSYEKKTVKK